MPAGQEKAHTVRNVFKVTSFGSCRISACTYPTENPEAPPWCNHDIFSVKPPMRVRDEKVQKTPIPQPGPENSAGESTKMKTSHPPVRMK